ncbi:MAG TPA: ABC transporter permease [Thermoanaerobaculia bacterium]|nr:ABC transporter permease [Thermoanaerobaculia bacterium]HUM28965.1 ABC transporter permease [Thermoanaerobaculia bacterium]HXK67103.1 ABC transporter permease [Thermoanaerobaculia bacterium]
MPRPSLIVQLFFRTARLQKKRMMLTIMAITWGTISILLLLSFGEGLKRNMMKGRAGLGEDIVIIWPGETEKPYQGFPPGRDVRLVPEDVDLVLREIPEIYNAHGEMTDWNAQIAFGEKIINQRVIGTNTAYGELRNHVAEAGGRFINILDEERKRRVIFLGDELKQDLMGDADAIGKTVTVNRVPFTVIGVMKKKLQMGMYGGPDSRHAVIPLSTFQAIYGRHYLNNFVFKPASPELMKVARRRLNEVLGGKHGYDPDDKRALYVWDTQEGAKIMGNIMFGLEIFLGIIGGLTLLIGGIGVANIMFAVVKRRTKEIGLVMALGARKSIVMGQLVLEALLLTFVGGLAGIGIGTAIIQLLAHLQAQSNNEALQFLGQPTISLPIALTTVGLLGGIGFLAGYMPSRRAVTIQPAEALRYE